MNLNCRQASELISASMDRPLTRWERTGLAIHLLICSYCRRFRKQLMWLRRVMRRVLQQADRGRPQSLSPAARNRIRRAVGIST
jgi:hypothetical protein